MALLLGKTWKEIYKSWGHGKLLKLFIKFDLNDKNNVDKISISVSKDK